MKLNPVFNDLNNPATILNHVEELKVKAKQTPHAEILHQLIEQFEPLDFEVLAFPQAEKLREQLEKANVLGKTRKRPTEANRIKGYSKAVG
jgi:putative DNA primase/helicase